MAQPSDSALGPPTMGDHDDAARRAAAYDERVESITYEVELLYGPDGIGPGEPSPTESDIADAVAHGLAAGGFQSVDVRVTRQ